jgi:ribosomal protein S15P/S13E
MHDYGPTHAGGATAPITAEPQGQPSSEQVKETVRDKSEEVAQQAQQLGGQVQNRIKEEVDTRSTQAADQLAAFSEGIRKMQQHLQSEGRQNAGNVTAQVAQQTDRLARYLRNSDPDRMLRDVEGFARRQPWLLAAGGVALGFAASRFLKASSSKRYEGSEGYRQLSDRQESSYLASSDPAPVTYSTYEERGQRITSPEFADSGSL